MKHFKFCYSHAGCVSIFFCTLIVYSFIFHLQFFSSERLFLIKHSQRPFILLSPSPSQRLFRRLESTAWPVPNTLCCISWSSWLLPKVGTIVKTKNQDGHKEGEQSAPHLQLLSSSPDHCWGMPRFSFKQRSSASVTVWSSYSFAGSYLFPALIFPW